MEAPKPISINEEIIETIIIDQDNIKYTININSIGNRITFTLEYNSDNYTKNIFLKDIKDKESVEVFSLYKCKDFIQFLKKLSEMKKILLIKKDNSFIIKFDFEVMFQKHNIEIELTIKDKNIELIENELKELKKENIELKKRIEDLEMEVKEIKKILNLNYNISNSKIGSVIMKENEFAFIRLAIEIKLK